MAAISYDPVDTLAAFSRQRGITFPLLSDAGSATIKKYGILNPVPEEALGPNKDDPAVKADIQKYVSVVNPTAAMVGIAFPGTFILDRKGRVTSRFFEDFYIERNTVSSLLVRVGANAAPVAATKISSAHLDLTTYPSDPAIAPGNRFSLVMDIKPGPGIHVYAPGAKGYRPIALIIAPQANVRVLPVQYPPSQIYFFKPLKQAALRGKETLTLTGTLDYQACDDKQCYNPASVPLSWTLALRPLVRERPNLKK